MPYHRDARILKQNAEYEFEQYQETIENHDPNVTQCCVPSGCCVGEPIRLDELSNTIKVVCNNEQCQEGTFMHRLCFDAWEQSVLMYLRSTGRARSWSEKQRLQNLWTKKGYDLAFKACGCRCAKGHLRKDLDWLAPQSTNYDAKKKKSRRKKNDKPALGLGCAAAPAMLTGSNGGGGGVNAREGRPMLRIRTNSLSSTSSSPPNSSSAESPSSPVHSGSGGRRKIQFEFFSDRQTGGSIFSRRMDFSSFNTLPRHKINSYHIKVKLDGRQQYLCAVCMGCLEGWNTMIRCRYCYGPWDGSSLILGTMYSYDIFAATPCCGERLKCNNCHRQVMMPEQRLAFFSDYSHSLPCPHCRVLDFHFVKSLSTYNKREREQ
uniref:Headcase middle domain-containing protein n=1 Tax=Strigamia maritima TaxID=126957 RepID=T1ILC9_STRMM